MSVSEVVRDEIERAKRYVEFAIAHRLDRDPVLWGYAQRHGDSTARDLKAVVYDRVALLLRRGAADPASLEPKKRDELRQYFHASKLRGPRDPGKLRERLESIVAGRAVARELGSVQRWTDYICTLARTRPCDGSVLRAAAVDSPLAEEALEAGIFVQNELAAPLARASMPSPQPVAETWLLIFDHGHRLIVSLHADDSALIHYLYAPDNTNPSEAHWRVSENDGREIQAGNWNYRLRSLQGSPFRASAEVELDVNAPKVDFRQTWDKAWARAWSLSPSDALPRPRLSLAEGTAFRLAPQALPVGGLEQPRLIGSWLKISEVGGTFYVDLEDGGVLRERRVFRPNKDSQGHWWVDGEPSRRALHLWLGVWRLTVLESEQQREEALRLANKSNFILPDAAQYAVRCIEHEPRLNRETEFLLVRVWQPDATSEA